LAAAKMQSFNDAFEAVLALAATDYEGSQVAASLGVQLFDSVLPEGMPVDELERLLWRFRSATIHASTVAPVLGVVWRHCRRDDRRSLWSQLRKFEYWADIRRAIEHGPSDWTSDEVDAFTIAIGGRTSPPTELDRIPRSRTSGAEAEWRSAH